MSLVGKQAPNFSMQTTRDLARLSHVATLDDYKGKWLVLFFYPLDFTFVCPTEITAFSDEIDSFSKLHCEVLGVSTDSVYSHRAWIKTPIDQNGIGEIRYPLASDITKETARSFGVLLEEKGIALRGLFIIDPEGIVRYEVVHELNVGRSVHEVLRVLEALQTGELCPANWEPGKAQITV